MLPVDLLASFQHLIHQFRVFHKHWRWQRRSRKLVGLLQKINLLLRRFLQHSDPLMTECLMNRFVAC
jgi:hypothetical protein